MTRIHIETDILARDIGQHLATAQYAMAAAQSQANLDYSFGLIAAIHARGLAALVLDNLEDEKTDDYRRYRDFNREAMKLIDQFWTVFRLVILTQAITGEQRVVQVEQAKPRPAPYAPNGKPPKKARQFHSSDIKEKVLTELKDQPSNVGIREWLQAVAEDHHIPFGTIARWYYGTSHG